MPGPRNTLETLADLLWCLSTFQEPSAPLPGALLIAAANVGSSCSPAPEPSGAVLGEEPCCVQMFILGCAIHGSGHPGTSSGCALALSQLKSLASLPRGLYNLSVSSFVAVQELTKHIGVLLTVRQCRFPKSHGQRMRRGSVSSQLEGRWLSPSVPPAWVTALSSCWCTSPPAACTTFGQGLLAAPLPPPSPACAASFSCPVLLFWRMSSSTLAVPASQLPWDMTQLPLPVLTSFPHCLLSSHHQRAGSTPQVQCFHGKKVEIGEG